MIDKPGFDHGAISIDKGHLSYYRRPGPGPAVVLIPGSWSDASQWQDVVGRLDPNLDLILIELPGHGESWPPRRDGSIEQFAVDTLAVMDHLGIERFYIGGHSIGGMIAKEMARAQGPRVKGVLACEGWTNYHAQEDAFGGPTRNEVTPEQERKMKQARVTTDTRWTDAQRKQFGGIWRTWDGYAFLCGTDIPILEVYGDRGRERPSHEALKVPDRPNIELVWIPGAGHSGLPLVRPEELAAAFTAFIRRIEAQTTP